MVNISYILVWKGGWLTMIICPLTECISNKDGTCSKNDIVLDKKEDTLICKSYERKGSE